MVTKFCNSIVCVNNNMNQCIYVLVKHRIQGNDMTYKKNPGGQVQKIIDPKTFKN